MPPLTYAGVGVDYGPLDAFKREAQQVGRGTGENLRRHGFSEVEDSRGESAYLMELPDCFLAHVEEGLGTKNLVAAAMYRLTGTSYYDQIAQDTVAMIVNDMITLGALPLSVAMHLAVGDAHWFSDTNRWGDLLRGWKHACMLSRCSWGCGETPTLKGIVVPGTVVLSGSALGIIKPKNRMIRADIQDGDAIILIESSGIHANGLTLARTIAEKLPDGYLTRLADGRTYGETLLAPTHIYVPVIESCLNAGIYLHYAVNITGHGWRKLMRATTDEHFAFVVERLPTPQPLFEFMQQHGPLDRVEAYGTLNMGAGFALYVDQDDVQKTLSVITACGYTGFRAGYIQRCTETRVDITPYGMMLPGSSLNIR